MLLSQHKTEDSNSKIKINISVKIKMIMANFLFSNLCYSVSQKYNNFTLNQTFKHFLIIFYSSYFKKNHINYSKVRNCFYWQSYHTARKCNNNNDC